VYRSRDGSSYCGVRCTEVGVESLLLRCDVDSSGGGRSYCGLRCTEVGVVPLIVV
jgi:hypothetical protein